MCDPVSAGIAAASLIGGFVLQSQMSQVSTPELPSLPEMPEYQSTDDSSTESMESASKRRAALLAKKGIGSTILTSGQGVTEQAVTGKKTLLGT